MKEYKESGGAMPPTMALALYAEAVQGLRAIGAHVPTFEEWLRIRFSYEQLED